MPILILCTSCNRKLRVQDHLLGKTVKCPHCQNKFSAQPVPEPAKPAGLGDELMPTPVVPPLQTLQLAEPASPAPAGPPRSNEQITTATPPAAAAPPAPQPFEIPPLRI